MRGTYESYAVEWRRTWKFEAVRTKRSSAANLAADANPRWSMGSPWCGCDGGPARHLYRIRKKLGQRQQYPLPRIQALGSRRRNQHTAHRALAKWDPGIKTQPPRNPAWTSGGPDGDLRR